MRVPGGTKPTVENAVRVLLVIGAAVALSLTGAMLVTSMQTGGGDFQWSGARLLLHGSNPYRAYLDGTGTFLGTQTPNYLHLLFLILLPFAALPFPLARGVWAVVNLAMCAVAAHRMARAVHLEGPGLAAFMLVSLCNVPLMIVLRNGQHSLLVLLCSVLALSVTGVTGGGFAAALAATKYSFAAPLFLTLGLRRHYHAGLVGVCLTVGSAAAMGIITGTPPLLGLIDPMRVTLSPNAMSAGVADIMTVAGRLLPGQARAVAVILGIVASFVLVACGRRVLASGHWVDALALSSVAALLCYNHLIYDYVMLLPLVLTGSRMKGVPRLVVLSVCGYFLYLRLLLDQWFSVASTPYALASLLLLLVAFRMVAVHAPRQLTAAPDELRTASV